jgi:hypothetical protein
MSISLPHLLVLSATAALIAATADAAPVSTAFKIDNFGYRPGDAKIAVLSANPGASVQVRDSFDVVVFQIPADGGSITSMGNDGPPSGDTIWWVDFTPFDAQGTYRLYSPSLNAQSYDFDIRSDVYADVTRAALHSFYYQRCNTPKTATHAGAWADGSACHMSDLTTGPAAGHTNHGLKDLTGGWHDAGDYNKYVWSAVSTSVLTMLRAYEDNPAALRDDDTDIPESGNGFPDLLDEIKWELDWMLKMQLGDGSLLSQMHVDGFASDSPPSADTNLRYYQNPNLESGAVAAGTFALAARIYDSEGMTAYATTLRQAALAAWSWLSAQPQNSEPKVWAAAEIFRTDPTQIAARNYVDGFHSANWSGVFFDVLRYNTQAAITYVQTPGATAAVVSNMRASMGAQVDYIFSENDLYRNGMPSWSYFWGSNIMRANYGLMLLTAARLGETGSHTADECEAHALDFLHFFHGQNALNMVYLTNMAALGGEHSSFQFYHAWFGDSHNTFSRNNFIGKPTAVVEPDYPYFKGTDNFGISDSKVSALGPAPGFVPGGPNKDYSGTAFPPKGAAGYNKFYRDWNDQTEWTVVTWEITENSIGYQGPYLALAMHFLGTPVCDNDDICEDGETIANCPNDCAVQEIDFYAGYKAKPLRSIVDNELPRAWVITADDVHIDNAADDDPENFEVGRVKSMLNAAVWNGAGSVLDNQLHYVRYGMKSGPQTVGPAVNSTFPRAARHIERIWHLSNSLGTIRVQSKKVSALLLPAGAAEGSAPPAPGDATHYICYKVKPTRDITAQTPGGRFARGLQGYTRDFLDDCATDQAGNASFAGTAVEASCLFDLNAVVELCNPMNKAVVEPPRATTAIITGSAATTAQSLLCYKNRTARTFTHGTAAALAGAATGEAIDPAQRGHIRRTLQTAPGNGFPAPLAVGTTKREMTCLPSDVLSVSTAP